MDDKSEKLISTKSSNSKKRLENLGEFIFNEISYDHNGDYRGDDDHSQINRAIAVEDLKNEITPERLLDILKQIVEDPEKGKIPIYSKGVDSWHAESKDDYVEGNLNLEFYSLSGADLAPSKNQTKAFKQWTSLYHSPSGENGGVLVLSDFMPLLPNHLPEYMERYDRSRYLEMIVRKFTFKQAVTHSGMLNNLNTGWSVVFICHTIEEYNYAVILRDRVFEERLFLYQYSNL